MEKTPTLVVLPILIGLVIILYLLSTIAIEYIKSKRCHKWQTRGVNRYGIATYRVCLKCGKREQWYGGINGSFNECERTLDLDSQFDEKGNLLNQQ